MAPQLTRTTGPLLRRLRAWIARAITSLPDPVSPRISTGAEEHDARNLPMRLQGTRDHRPFQPGRHERTRERGRLSRRESVTRPCANQAPRARAPAGLDSVRAAVGCGVSSSRTLPIATVTRRIGSGSSRRPARAGRQAILVCRRPLAASCTRRASVTRPRRDRRSSFHRPGRRSRGRRR